MRGFKDFQVLKLFCFIMEITNLRGFSLTDLIVYCVCF